MKKFKHSVNTNFMRICRIQINSPQRNQNLYGDHYYKIKCKIDTLYEPGTYDYIRDLELEIYCNKTDQFFYTNTRNFYYKLTNDNDNVYMDIGVYVDNYSDNVNCDIECVSVGSVEYTMDSATISDFTRIDFYAENLKMAFKGTTTYAWTGAYTHRKICVPKIISKYHDYDHAITSVTIGNDIINSSNDSWTITEISNNTYNRIIDIYPKRNCALFIETIDK